MAEALEVPPILSTPDTHILEFSQTALTRPSGPARSDEELRVTYEIDRTLKDIRQGRWRRIALQFPDEMLPDAPRVFQLLSHGLAVRDRTIPIKHESSCQNNLGAESTRNGQKGDKVQEAAKSIAENMAIQDPYEEENSPRMYILADTSY